MPIDTRRHVQPNELRGQLIALVASMRPQQRKPYPRSGTPYP